MNPATSQPASAASPSVSATAADTAASKQSVTGSRWLLMAALMLPLVWLLFLGALAFWTANPATWNIQQLRLTDALVVAEIVDAEQGKIRVQETLFERQPHSLPPGTELTLPQHGPHWTTGTQRIFPLTTIAAGHWQIAPAPLPQQPLLDYPVETGLKNQLKDLLPTLQDAPRH